MKNWAALRPNMHVKLTNGVVVSVRSVLRSGGNLRAALEEFENVKHKRDGVLTLHQAIARVLADQENLSASEIATAINAQKLYTRADGCPVSASQISARFRKHPNLFIRIAGKIRLAGVVAPLPTYPKESTLQQSGREVTAYSAPHDLKFLDLGRVSDLIEHGLPGESRLNHCGVYMLTVSPGYMPRFIHPEEARAARNVISAWNVECLKSKWVSKTEIVYIGLAGRFTPRSLRERLRDLLKHASGKTSDRGPHKGGEIVWQLRDYQQFHVWAAPTTDPPAPREIERKLLQQFAKAHGTLPFANRKR